MRIETPLIAVILASLFFFGMWSVFVGKNSLSDNYAKAGLVNVDSPTGTDYQINNGTVNLMNAFNKVEQNKEAVSNISNEFSTLRVNFASVFTAIQIVYQTGKVLVNNVLIINDIGTASTQVFGFDSMITTALFTILLLLIIIGVILIIAGRVQ